MSTSPTNAYLDNMKWAARSIRDRFKREGKANEEYIRRQLDPATRQTLMEELKGSPLQMLPGLESVVDAQTLTEGEPIDQAATLASIIVPGLTGPMAKRLASLKPRQSDILLTPEKDALELFHGTTHPYPRPTTEGMAAHLGETGSWDGPGYYQTPRILDPIRWAAPDESWNLASSPKSPSIHNTALPLEHLQDYIMRNSGNLKRFTGSQSEEVLNQFENIAGDLAVPFEKVASHIPANKMLPEMYDEFTNWLGKQRQMGKPASQAEFFRQKLLANNLRGYIAGDNPMAAAYVTLNPDELLARGQYKVDPEHATNVYNMVRDPKSQYENVSVKEAIDWGDLNPKEYISWGK